MLLKSVAMKIYGLLASIIIIVILLLFSIPLLKPKYEGRVVSFLTENRTVGFNVEVADTPIKRTIGLMNRTALPEKSGMLFIFDQEGIQGFWMKNTLIPLDMVFISADKKITHIQRNAQPCKTLDCQIYSSEKPAKYVVEINGGLADKLGIKEGWRVGI
ncbi:MAG: DUF192 domain-containing protein [Candidatus Aenigmarchaeota archaeon]|nr:DUF192 domain-containing protein [Candidatus Aenigmarchaeota archaeon]